MAANSDTLELVFIDIQARTKDLDEQLKRLVDRVEEQGRRAGTAFSAALGGALNTTTDAAREVTAATSAVAATVDNQLAPALNGAASAARDAAIGQKDLDKALADIRDRAQAVKAEYEGGAIGVREFAEQSRALKAETVQLLSAQGDQGASLKRIAAELKATDDLTKELGVAVRSVRSAFIAGRIGTDEFREASTRLKGEIDELYKSTDLTAQQQLRLNIAAATAERGLASLDGKASRLGLAWNVQIGLANQFEQQLRGLGPVGQAAAGGLGLVQRGFEGLSRPIDVSRISFDGFLQSAVRAPQVLALAGAALTTVALASMARLASQAAKVADDLDKASASVGATVEEFQELQFALSQSGVNADSVRTALGNLNTRLGEAINGNEKYRSTLQGLGVDLEAVKAGTVGVGGVLATIADGIANIATPAEQAAAATTLFGARLGNQLLPALQQGSEGLADLRQQARDLGLVISGDAIVSLVEYADTVEALKQQFRTAGVEITAAFLPILRDVLIPLIQNNLVPWLQNAAAGVADFAQRFVDAGEDGQALRAKLVELLTPILAITDSIIGAGQGFLAFANFALGGVAATGAVIGDLSVQVGNLARQFSTLTEGLRWYQQGNLLGAVEILRRASNIDVRLDFSQTAEAAIAASAPFFERANNFSLASGERFGRAFVTGYADLIDGLAVATQDGVSRATANLFGVGQDAGADLAGGILSGAERTFVEGSLGLLRQELQAAQQAFDAAGDEAGRAFYAGIIDGVRESIREIERLYKAIDVSITPTIELRPDPSITRVPTTPDFVQFSLDFAAEQRLEAVKAAQEARAAELELAEARRRAANDALRQAEEGLQLLTGVTQQAIVEAARVAQAEAAAAATAAADAERDLAEARRASANATLRQAEEGFQLETGVSGQAAREAAAAEAVLEAARRKAANDALRLAEEGFQLQSGAVLAQAREDAVAAAAEIVRVEAQLAQARQRAAVITGAALSPTEALVQELQAIVAPTEELREAIAELARSLLDAEASAAAAAAAADAADAAKRAQKEFEQLAVTAINVAGQVADGFVSAFRDFQAGNAGGGLGTLLGSAGAIAGLFNPIAGTILGVLGGFIGNLFGVQGRPTTDLERTRAGGTTSRSAPAVEVNFTYNVTAAFQNVASPETRLAMQRIADDAIEEFVRRSGLANLLRERLSTP